MKKITYGFGCNNMPRIQIVVDTLIYKVKCARSNSRLVHVTDTLRFCLRRYVVRKQIIFYPYNSFVVTFWMFLIEILIFFFKEKFRLCNSSPRAKFFFCCSLFSDYFVNIFNRCLSIIKIAAIIKNAIIKICFNIQFISNEKVIFIINQKIYYYNYIKR